MKHIIYDRSAHMFFHPNRMAGPAPSYTMELVVTTWRRSIHSTEGSPISQSLGHILVTPKTSHGGCEA